MLFCWMIRMFMDNGAFHLFTLQDEEERHLKLVELNVIEQCLNLYKTGAVCEQVCWV